MIYFLIMVYLSKFPEGKFTTYISLNLGCQRNPTNFMIIQTIILITFIKFSSMHFSCVIDTLQI